MPTPKQMENGITGGSTGDAGTATLGPPDDLPQDYWDAVLRDPRGQDWMAPDPGRGGLGNPAACPAGIVPALHHTGGIQTADAVRLYGPHAICKETASKGLLDNSCQQRTGSMKRAAAGRSMEWAHPKPR